jgi:hypothetical protein
MMAIAYKSFALNAPASPTFTAVYTVPALTSAMAKDIHASNVDGAGAVTISIRLVKAVGPVTVYLLKGTTINVGGAIDKKNVILETGDKIEVSAGAASDVDISMSVVEFT